MSDTQTFGSIEIMTNGDSAIDRNVSFKERSANKCLHYSTKTLLHEFLDAVVKGWSGNKNRMLVKVGVDESDKCFAQQFSTTLEVEAKRAALEKRVNTLAAKADANIKALNMEQAALQKRFNAAMANVKRLKNGSAEREAAIKAAAEAHTKALAKEKAEADLKAAALEKQVLACMANFSTITGSGRYLSKGEGSSSQDHQSKCQGLHHCNLCI
jgi:seryl-tRNA synthetase